MKHASLADLGGPGGKGALATTCPDRARLLHRYRIHGWILATERPLPLLRPLEPADTTSITDIDVRFAPLCEPVAEDIVFSRGGVFLLTDGSAFIAGHGVRIRIEAGARLIVDVMQSLSDAELHTWLFGAAMGVLCHQREQPPLHASVVEIDGQAVAFAGISGAGKSTMAQVLLRRGHRLLTDDQAIIDPDTLLVQPAFPSMKLWRGTDGGENCPADPALRVRAGVDKYHFPLGDLFRSRATPLAMILALRTDTSLRRPSFETVNWQHAATLLQRRLVFRPGVARSMDGGRSLFRWAVAIARKVPLQILRRPNDMRQLEDICDHVETMISEGIGA
jgi:hypothetical protein